MEILQIRKSVILQAAPDSLLRGSKPDTGTLQLCSVHHKVPLPAFFGDLYGNAQCFGKLPGRAHHVLCISAAKIVYAAGQVHGGFQIFDHLPHIGHAAVVVPGEAQSLSLQRGTQKIQRQIAPDGQP